MAERESWYLIAFKAVIAFIVAFWLGLPEAVKTLIALQALDILLGFFVAWSNAQLRSGIAWRGMLKKAGALVVIGVTHLIDPVLNLQASTVVAVYYCASETLSVLENAGKLGVPLPKFLTDRLEKLRDIDNR